MSDFVIDASAALAWMLRSQSTRASADFLEARVGDNFLAPHIFSWEVGNVLVGLHRRRGLSDGAHAEALDSLDALEVAIQPALSAQDIRALDVLARDLGLSLFDVAYLALAAERSCAMVTRDERLLAVAAAHDVDYVDLRGDA